MTSPIAGNENFTNVSTLAAQVPSLDAGFARVKSLVPYASRPPLSGLGQVSLTDPTTNVPQTILANGTGTSAPEGGVLRNNSVIESLWDGSVEVTVTLPAALAGSVVVIHQNAVADGGTGDLNINCGSGDVFVTNSCVNYGITSATALSTTDLLIFSAQGNNQLTVLNGSSAINAFDIGSMLYFNCTDNGFWHVSHELRGVDDVTAANALSFSTV